MHREKFLGNLKGNSFLKVTSQHFKCSYFFAMLVAWLETSQQLLEGLLKHFVQMFMVHRRLIQLILVIPPHFSYNATVSFIFVVSREISCNDRWDAMEFCADTHGCQRMNLKDLS